MRRNRYGGIVAALANKNHLGKVVKTFPPVAMLSNTEAVRAKRLVRLAMGRAKKERNAVNGAKATEATPAVATWGRGDAEWQAWQRVCALLTETRVVTDADLRTGVSEPAQTPGVRILQAIRTWGDAFASLPK